MVNEASTADETVAILTSTADEDMADCRERGVHAADKATGTFASTLDEAAKAPSIADEASTADKAVAISTRIHDRRGYGRGRGRVHGGRGVNAARGHRLMRTRQLEAARAQECVFPFLFLYFYSNAIFLLAQTQATESRRVKDSRCPPGLRTSTRGCGRC